MGQDVCCEEENKGLHRAFDVFIDKIETEVDALRIELKRTIDVEDIDEILKNLMEDIRNSVNTFYAAIVWELEYGRAPLR